MRKWYIKLVKIFLQSIFLCIINSYVAFGAAPLYVGVFAGADSRNPAMGGWDNDYSYSIDREFVSWQGKNFSLEQTYISIETNNLRLLTYVDGDLSQDIISIWRNWNEVQVFRQSWQWWQLIFNDSLPDSILVGNFEGTSNKDVALIWSNRFQIWKDNIEWIDTDNFRDVPFDFWAYPYIQSLRKSEITQGCGTTPPMYCPTNSVTRSEMAVFIIRSMIEAGFLPNNFDYSSIPFFTDVPTTHWAFKYIQKMRELNITSGCSDNAYCPDEEVTRAQMAVFITRALGEQPAATCTGSVFNDVDAQRVGGFCRFIERFATLGITSGCEAMTPQLLRMKQDTVLTLL